MDDAKPLRGRPQLLTTEELRSRAIAVVSAHGYDSVTMATVAAEVGVSLRTLHRHFPSKVDLVWGALDESFTRLREELANTDPAMPVVRAVHAAIVASFSSPADGQHQHRERLRLIAITPELQAAQSDAFRQWRDGIVDFAASRLDLSTDDLVPMAIGAATQSATLAGLTWWAMHDDTGSPALAVGSALRALEEHGH